MGAIFLSASVPVPGRGTYHEDASPFLIQFAVRELLTVILGRRLLVWGGHPAITPMVWSVCEDIGVSYANAVHLFQSLYFKDVFPEENARFQNVTYTDAVDGDLQASVSAMRDCMLQGTFDAGVFIGGMEGIFDEFHRFRERHRDAAVVVIGSGGGAARQLAHKLGVDDQRIDFASLFMDALQISPLEKRRSIGFDSGTRSTSTSA
jgi:hypothetical protein